MAPKVFDTAMCLSVGCQRALDGEGAVTLAALIWLFMSMDTNVPHKVTWLLELLRTIGALMPPHTINLSKKTKSFQQIDNNCLVPYIIKFNL